MSVNQLFDNVCIWQTMSVKQLVGNVCKTVMVSYRPWYKVLLYQFCILVILSYRLWYIELLYIFCILYNIFICQGRHQRKGINEKGPTGPPGHCAAQFFRYHRSSFDHSGFLWYYFPAGRAWVSPGCISFFIGSSVLFERAGDQRSDELRFLIWMRWRNRHEQCGICRRAWQDCSGLGSDVPRSEPSQ